MRRAAGSSFEVAFRRSFINRIDITGARFSKVLESSGPKSHFTLGFAKRFYELSSICSSETRARSLMAILSAMYRKQWCIGLRFVCTRVKHISTAELLRYISYYEKGRFYKDFRFLFQEWIECFFLTKLSVFLFCFFLLPFCSLLNVLYYESLKM